MSQLSAVKAHGHEHHEDAHLAAARSLDHGLVHLKPGAWRMAGTGLLFLGVLSCVVLVIGVLAGGGGGGEAAKNAIKHALGAYHTGFLYAVGLVLGCLGLQMILQQVNAGWSAAVRRQAENVASLAWVLGVLFLPVAILELLVTKGVLFKWMDDAYVAGDVLYTHKQPYLNEPFWAVRAVIYFVVWISLGTVLYRLSRRQDQTGDKWLTARARWISSFGLLLFALTTAFASFDWLMSLDFHWFSTMFGVYFFAGSVVSAVALLCVVLCTLRIQGKLGPTFTKEHQHDLGKLLFAFTVFWAYITLCQYFLIWYSNIPEETAFYIKRQTGTWRYVSIAIAVGHFAMPFLFLLIRDLKRNAHTLRLVALWMLVMHAVDLIYMVRPVIEKGGGPKLGAMAWIDVAGILGPVCLLLGFLVMRIGSTPLVPLKDPRLHEVLTHKNYV